MLTFILKRVAQSIPVLLGVVTLVFFMTRLAPGGPFDSERALPEGMKESLERHYRLDQPTYVQYAYFLKHLVLEGDLGLSFRYPATRVNTIIKETLPVSLELTLWSLCVAMGLGVLAGLMGALNPGGYWDKVGVGATTLGMCLPTFVTGPLLILVFAIKLNGFHASGWHSLGDRVLPALSLGFFYAAYAAKFIRTSLVRARSQDYIRTARAKGLGELRIFLVHGLRGSLGPALNVMGPIAAAMVSGSFVTETIFNIPGLGLFYVTSAFNRDYTLIMGTVIVYAVAVVGFNLCVDILQAWLNPSQKLQ